MYIKKGKNISKHVNWNLHLLKTLMTDIYQPKYVLFVEFYPVATQGCKLC